MILEQLNMLDSISDRESHTYRITHYLLENRHSIIEYKVNLNTHKPQVSEN